MKNIKMYQGMLIVIDMVNGFIREGVLHDKKLESLIPRQLELIKEAKHKGYVIVFIKDNHTKESVEFQRFGNTTHCLEGTSEAELVDELKPYEKEAFVFKKNSTSFMFAEGFIEFLNQLEQLKTVEFCGVCTDICDINGILPMMNYFDQINKKIEVIGHLDAMGTYGSLTHPAKEYEKAAKLLLEQQGVQLVKNFK